MHIQVDSLLEYTDWERRQWHAWFSRQGPNVLAISAGPHGDGRFETIGHLVRHMFSAEKRYVDRLSGRELTETTLIPTDDLDVLFQLGKQSREDLRTFLRTFPVQDWDISQEFTILKYQVRATPRKIILHVLFHEIRHWAQIGTLLRLQGFAVEFHDVLGSPVLSG